MAPRKLARAMTLIDIQDEIRFTTSATRADPDAAPFSATAESWQAQINDVLELDAQISQQAMDAAAQRQVANARLDKAVIRFTDELLLSVDKDRNNPRWTYFCPVPPSKLILEPLMEQQARVAGWLANSDDAVLNNHRAELTQWNNALGDALAQDRAVAARRLELKQKKEALAADLTAQRDALSRQMDDLAHQQGLGRTWSSTFFRKTKSSKKKSTAAAPPPEASTPPSSPS